MVQAHFTNCAGWKNIEKNAFVRLKLQENGYPVQSKLLTIQTIPYRYSPKQSTQSRSAVILRIFIAKRHVAAGTNSPSPNNEKRTTYAQQNLLKREQSKPEHKALKPYSELGISDLHLNTADYIPVNPRQPTCPAAADNPGVRRWSPEDGGEGLRRVHLLRPLVRRKATIKSTRMTWYSSLVKPERRSKE